MQIRTSLDIRLATHDASRKPELRRNELVRGARAGHQCHVAIEQDKSRAAFSHALRTLTFLNARRNHELEKQGAGSSFQKDFLYASHPTS